MGFLGTDNFLTRFFEKAGDIILLNLLFLICSLPVITIGASTTALYYSCLKLTKNDGTIPRKNFFKSFRENFRQATGIWLGFLIAAAVLFTNYRFLTYTQTGYSKFFQYLMYGITAFILFIFLYVFPVIAAFRNKASALLKNAFLLSFMHFPTTLCLAVLWVFPIYLTFLDLQLFGLYLFCWIAFGFALLAYTSSTLLYRIFKKYLPPEDTEGSVA